MLVLSSWLFYKLFLFLNEDLLPSPLFSSLYAVKDNFREVGELSGKNLLLNMLYSLHVWNTPFPEKQELFIISIFSIPSSKECLKLWLWGEKWKSRWFKQFFYYYFLTEEKELLTFAKKTIIIRGKIFFASGKKLLWR